MKIVIDIPEDMYNDANILIVKDLPELKKIIENGIPLPKGHGDLIDRDNAVSEINKKQVVGRFNTVEVLNNAPAIITADK